MPAYAYQEIVPLVDPASYVHPLALLIGGVIIGPGASLRFRADRGGGQVERALSMLDLTGDLGGRSPTVPNIAAKGR